MKKKFLSSLVLSSLALNVVAQSKGTVNDTVIVKDTTQVDLGTSRIIFYQKSNKIEKITYTRIDTLLSLEVDRENKFKKDSLRAYKLKKRGHWNGLDFGTSILLNSSGQASFSNQTYLENDPSKSFYMNYNFFQKKFPIVRYNIGLLTGLGCNWTSIGIRDNKILNYNSDSVWTTDNTGIDFDKNKLRASYLTVPLFLEFVAKPNKTESMYLMVGMVGALKIRSVFIQKVENDKMYLKNKYKGSYALNSFKLDASLRVGYGNFGAFASYSLLPLFDTKFIQGAYPLSFGLSYVF
jgi:hypothetical protein